MFESWFPGQPDAGDPVDRAPDAQAAVDAATGALSLYHYDSCAFCARVRSAMARLALPIELRDVLRDRQHWTDLLGGGGKTTVPCLRIEHPDGAVEWMYESADICRYLERRFGPEASGT